MDEKEQFVDYLKSRNDTIEILPVNKLIKESGNDSGKGQTIERDDIGID